jgi:hypothetical protein
MNNEFKIAGFNAADEEYDEKRFAPVPVGDYKAILSDIALTTTKNGQGQYFACTFEIVEGEFANRLIFINLNVTNQNSIAQDIGRRTFAQICRAVGVIKPQSENDLLNKIMVISVSIETDKTGQYEPKNNIKKFAESSAAPVKSEPASRYSQAESVPPWKKK